LWAQELLVWLSVFVLANAGAALLAPPEPARRPLSALVWILALGLGTGPALLAMAGQCVFGRPFGGRWMLEWELCRRGVALALPYALLALGPLCLGVATHFP